jgi:hypothetical protein
MGCGRSRGFLEFYFNYREIFLNDYPYRLVSIRVPRKNFSAAEKTIETPKTPFSLSIAAIPTESIPIISVAVLIADTGYEL